MANQPRVHGKGKKKVAAGRTSGQHDLNLGGGQFNTANIQKLINYKASLQNSNDAQASLGQ